MYSEKNLSQYHTTHHKVHMDWPGIEPGPVCNEHMARLNPSCDIISRSRLIKKVSDFKGAAAYFLRWLEPASGRSN